MLCYVCKNTTEYPEDEKDRIKLLQSATQIYAQETNNSDRLLDNMVDSILHKCNLPYLLIYLDKLDENSGVGEEAFCICTWRSAGMYANQCTPIEIIQTANSTEDKKYENIPLLKYISNFIQNLF